MRIAATLVAVPVFLAGCTSAPPEPEKSNASVAIIPTAATPASKIEATRAGRHDGTVVGGVAGGAAGAYLGYGAAGALCTISGPLCAIIVIPAAIVGALVGGTAGSVADAITADPERVEKARAQLADAVAQMHTSEAVAKKAQESAGASALLLSPGEPDFRSLARRGIPNALEIAVTDFDVIPGRRDMAIELRLRSRLYRTSDALLMEQFEKTLRSDFRAYDAWAANDARPLRDAIDAACAELGQAVSAVHLRSPPRADISARQGG